jgi:hypothetical protein
MHLPQFSRVAISLVIFASLLGVTGCSRGAQGSGSTSGLPTSSAVASPSVDTSGSADSTASAALKRNIGETGPITDSQAAELEKELRAIEAELNGLDLPSDADFKGIDGDL